MKPMTPRQEWMLSHARERGKCEIHGRGGLQVARGLVKRGMGTIERKWVGSHFGEDTRLVDYFVAGGGDK